MEILNDENSRYICNTPDYKTLPTYSFPNSQCVMVGKKAPDFSANTTFGECKLSDYKRKMVSIFLSPR